jgi:hypothetical protein
MIRTAVGFLGLLAVLPALQARDNPEKQTPDQQYQALVKEFDTAQKEFQTALKEAKTPQEQQKVFQEKAPRPDKFAPRFLELAEKHPKDPAAVDALIWVVSHGRGNPRTKAITILLRDHVQSEKMASACPTLAYAWDKESTQLLREVLEKNKHRPARALACLALAQQTENRMRLAKRFKDQPERLKPYEGLMGKEAVEKLIKTKPEELSKEVEDLYERVVKEFANVTDASGNKLGDVAKEKLDALRHPIVVGKPAPEIEAEDIDGKKFKLSDYRGKVVLLDFWGNW